MFSGTTASAGGQGRRRQHWSQAVPSTVWWRGWSPNSPKLPFDTSASCFLSYAHVFPPEEHLVLHGLSVFMNSWIHGFQQAVVHSRSLNETWLSFLYQNQLSEMMSLGKLMENLLSTSPLLLSFGGWFLRQSLIWHSLLFLEPSCVGSTLHFFSSQRKPFWCLHRSDTKQPFPTALLSLVLLLEIIHVPTVLILPWKGGGLGCV